MSCVKAFLIVLPSLMLGPNAGHAQIVVGPYTFSGEAAFADTATSTNCAGGSGYPTGDCNENVIGYSPTVCNANINLNQPLPPFGEICTTTDYVELTFDDIPITNVIGPDLIVFDSRFSVDGYGIAVEVAPGVFSGFEVYSPDEQEELDPGSGCGGATLAAVPVDLSRYGLSLGATSTAVRIVSANFGNCEADLTMAAVLDGSLACGDVDDCNDGDPCTTDTCSAGECSYEPSGEPECEMPTTSSTSTTSTTIPPPGTCGASPAEGCLVPGKATLQVKEKVAGKEKLVVALKNLTALTTQGSFGDPVGGTTSYAVCIYDQSGALKAEMEVDRAGEQCGNKPCWKAVSTKGYKYGDKEASAGGIFKIRGRGGDVAKGQIQAKGRNTVVKGQTSLPTGIAAALLNETQVTVQILTSDASCFGSTLTNVRVADGLQFKAQEP
jgi:hypothetical protein